MSGFPQPVVYLDYFLPYEREQEVQSQMYRHPKHFQVSGIKISNVTKQFSQSLRELFHRGRI